MNAVADRCNSHQILLEVFQGEPDNVSDLFDFHASIVAASIDLVSNGPTRTFTQYARTKTSCVNRYTMGLGSVTKDSRDVHGFRRLVLYSLSYLRPRTESRNCACDPQNEDVVTLAFTDSP